MVKDTVEILNLVIRELLRNDDREFSRNAQKQIFDPLCSITVIQKV